MTPPPEPMKVKHRPINFGLFFEFLQNDVSYQQSTHEEKSIHRKCSIHYTLKSESFHKWNHVVNII